MPWIEKTEDMMMDAVDREDRGHDGWIAWIEKTEDTMDGFCEYREDRGHD